MKNWMIYGANGYTGELIAREAAHRGLYPIIAGRSREKIDALAAELQLEARVFDLSSAEAIARQLDGIDLVLHCAGPFSQTSAPMVKGCLAAQAHYLDITGEIAVFEQVLALHEQALHRGVTLAPGVGFDVVPSDCLAATLAQQLHDATDLLLAFHTPGGILSRGTMKTMLEGIGDGGAIRRDGKIVPVPLLFDVREIPFQNGPRTAMTIPWGDVSTAFHTTGIPNVRVYYATSPKRIRRLRWSAPLMKLARWSPIKNLLQKRADRQQGPDAAARERGRVYLYGRVTNKEGKSAEATMMTPEGYSFTVLSALAAVERLRSMPSQAGAYTPAKLFGAGFASTIDGVDGPHLIRATTSTT